MFFHEILGLYAEDKQMLINAGVEKIMKVTTKIFRRNQQAPAPKLLLGMVEEELDEDSGKQKPRGRQGEEDKKWDGEVEPK
jgi:hypothetical protein